MRAFRKPTACFDLPDTLHDHVNNAIARLREIHAETGWPEVKAHLTHRLGQTD